MNIPKKNESIDFSKIKNTLLELEKINIHLLNDQYIYALSNDVYVTNVDFVYQSKIKLIHYKMNVYDKDLTDYLLH